MKIEIEIHKQIPYKEFDTYKDEEVDLVKQELVYSQTVELEPQQLKEFIKSITEVVNK